MLSWLVISPFLGAYSRAATRSLTGIPAGIVIPWGISVSTALVIRGLVKGAVPPTPFIVVSLVSTLLLLSMGRFLYLSLIGVTSDDETKSAGFLEVFKMVGSLIKRW